MTQEITKGKYRKKENHKVIMIVTNVTTTEVNFHEEHYLCSKSCSHQLFLERYEPIPKPNEI